MRLGSVSIAHLLTNWSNWRAGVRRARGLSALLVLPIRFSTGNRGGPRVRLAGGGEGPAGLPGGVRREHAGRVGSEPAVAVPALVLDRGERRARDAVAPEEERTVRPDLVEAGPERRCARIVHDLEVGPAGRSVPRHPLHAYSLEPGRAQPGDRAVDGGLQAP